MPLAQGVDEREFPEVPAYAGKASIGAYGLTTGAGIVEALVRAKERGVDVRLIADRTTPLRAEQRY